MLEMDKLTPLNPKPIHLATLLTEAVESAFLMDERGSTRDSIDCHLGRTDLLPCVATSSCS